MLKIKQTWVLIGRNRERLSSSSLLNIDIKPVFRKQRCEYSLS